MKYTHIFWDFNGTLLDDVQAGIDSINVLLLRRGLPIVKDRAEYTGVFGFPIIDYYKRLGFDFTKESYNNAAVEWVEQYNIFSAYSTLYPNVINTLSDIKAAGIKQIILTATEYNMVCRQLDSLGISGCFDCVLGTDNIHAYGKINIALEYIKKEQPKKAVLIGDTTHDSDVASAAGIDCLLVSHGHHSYDVLKACGRRIFPDLSAVKEYLLQE